MRKIFKYLTHRMAIVSLLILLQIVWIALLFIRFTSYSQMISIAFRVLSMLVVLYIIRRNDNPAVKLAWIVVILMFPIFGGLLYLFIGGKKPIRNMRRKMESTLQESAGYLVFDPKIQEELNEEDTVAAGQVYYLENRSGFPACRDSEITYYPTGEECFEAMLEDLKKAKRYIFLEYFIIEEGIMWNSILKILEEKVKEGVDVRVMYDDVGSIFVLPAH